MRKFVLLHTSPLKISFVPKLVKTLYIFSKGNSKDLSRVILSLYPKNLHLSVLNLIL